MNFFRKFKDYVLGEDLKATSKASSDASSSSTAPGGFVQKVAVKQTVQPVLQNPGYGSSGGVQGLDWYTKGLKEDRDGDVATEFLEEASAPHPAQLRSTVEDAHASLQVQQHDLRPVGPGCVIVHEGDVHLVSNER
ncbi:g12932 [Coccomyxa viridis]|uniref:G12932 protein n=1 Tax=Coccomyxa viridis TaxID=1274662 RepID=A0ABP1GBJ4_9CHLO